MSDYRILETIRGFKVQRDIGHSISWEIHYEKDFCWVEEWLTGAIERTLNKAKKEIRRLHLINGGIIHDNE